MCSIPRAGTEASFTSTAPKWWSLSIAEKLIAGRLVAENINGRESIVIFFLNCSCVQNVSLLLISTVLEAGSFTLHRGL